jgi:hypothetical protein
MSTGADFSPEWASHGGLKPEKRHVGHDKYVIITTDGGSIINDSVLRAGRTRRS